MEICLRDGGDGARCWNVEPIMAHIRGSEARQAQLSRANPDLEVSPGGITCYGCTALDHGQGYGCTARLTQPLYRVRGEIGPRPSDAAASLSTIAGFRGRIDADLVQPGPPAAAGHQARSR
jgi:hypothetical protein